MKPTTLLLFTLCFTFSTFVLGQNEDQYITLVEEAMDLFKTENYQQAAEKYQSAFDQFEQRVIPNDLYNAACAYALANDPKNSFDLLFQLANEAKYDTYWHVATDLDLQSLHAEAKWPELLEIVRENKNETEGVQSNKILDLLDGIMIEDQSGRRAYRVAISNYGYDAPETKKVGREVWVNDSLHVIEVTHILDSIGWPPLHQIGRSGSNAIFLTLQHGDLGTQEKYLPFLKDAVAENKIAPGALALLEDRLNLRQGKRQIYGSQTNTNRETGEKYVAPLVEPEKVNERRAKVGLEPIEDYAKRKGIQWDVEKHKARIQKMESAENN